MDTQIDTQTISTAARLVSVAEMQAIEKAADAGGHSYAAMMARAGRAVAEAVLARYGTQPVLLLAGPGNNGGDGLVCARYLREAGAPVRVYLWQRRTDPDHEGHFASLVDLGVTTAQAGDDPNFETLRAWLAQSRVLVDALLGTGTNRPIEGSLADLLRAVMAEQEAHPLHVAAVDCASGLNCDTGAIDPLALRPELTVTFGFAKHGHYQFPGAEYVGDLIVADIGIGAQTTDKLRDDLRTFLISADVVQGWLPKRPRLSHKGTFGKVLLAVGSESFPGAAYLSCAAAARAGAGLVTGAVTGPVWPLVAARLAEPTWLPLPVLLDGELAGCVDPQAAALVAETAARYDALVLGCGLGNNAATREFVERLLPQLLPQVPVRGSGHEDRVGKAQEAGATHDSPAHLIDADGLNCLSALPDWPSRLPARCVLTPHPAEMARLCGMEVAGVVASRWALARERAAAWGCTVLLKGPYTVVAHPDGWLGVLPVATPALATAGSGDVLSGVIGGLLAQGLEPFTAACTGAFLHGQAGLRCEEEIGPAGVIASDLLTQLPAVLRSLVT